MNEKKLNMFAKEEEYAALRHFVKMVGSSKDGGMAASVKRAIDRELTKRQRQLVYIDRLPWKYPWLSVHHL